MRIFLYEFITGGGTWREGAAAVPRGSLLKEGAAMIRALAADFRALADAEVWSLRDSRLAGFELPGCRVHDVNSASAETAALERLAAAADWSLIIAPELERILLRRCRRAERAGARLLSPASDLIAVAADKHQTARRLAANNVPVPRGIALSSGGPPPDQFPWPAVLKPRLGAGSVGLQLVSSPEQLAWTGPRGVAYRLEQYCPGTAASVAVLSGPGQAVPLPACRQHLSGEGKFHYRGGALPLAEHLAQRAKRLALAALAALPAATGYVGVDLVLGEDPDGREDYVIEVNPRLTTSYVGLRAAARSNLADAMLRVAQGQKVELSFSNKRVEFKSDGAVRVSGRGP